MTRKLESGATGGVGWGPGGGRNNPRPTALPLQHLPYPRLVLVCSYPPLPLPPLTLLYSPLPPWPMHTQATRHPHTLQPHSPIGSAPLYALPA